MDVAVVESVLRPALSRPDDALWRLARSSETLGSLVDVFNRVDHLPGEQIATATVMVEADDPIASIASPAANTEVLTVGGVSLLRVEDDHGDFVLSAWPTAHEGVFHLVSSIPATDARWRKIERWIAKAAPAVVPVFLNHDDFADVGTALSEFGEVEVSRLTARKPSDLSSLNRGWPVRSGSLRPSPLAAIADADTEGASVRTLTLHIQGKISLHLRRLAGATFYSGDFPLFYTVVLGRLASAAGRRRALLSGRARRTDVTPREPITIRLSSPVLTDAEATGAVLDELQHQRDMSIAVLHRNPYLHVVVTDYSDGSNFDVFVTTPDAIEVHPGFRASMGALTRLTQSLGERFSALEIAEAATPAPVSLDDLIVNV